MDFALQNWLSLALGVGLAAACGFRVFVPFLLMSSAAHTGYLELSSGFRWIGSTPALVAFGSATALEIAAYYIPWVDNLLDSVSAPVAVIAGTVVTASALTDIDPFLKWSLAVIAGGGVAGVVSGGTAILRGASTAATGGLANPVFSTIEAVTSFVLSLLAIVLPLAAVVVVVVLFVFAFKKIFGRPARRQEVEAAGRQRRITSSE